MKKLLSIAALSALLPIVACSTETVVKNVPPAGETPAGGTPAAAVTIGAEGGSVEADGILLEVPAGALDEETSITITKTEEEAPAPHVGVTPVYKFEPDGLKFKKAAKVTYTKLPADTSGPVIGWAKSEGVYEGLVTTAEGITASAAVSLLASTFVAASECLKDGTVAAVCKPVPAPATLKSGRKINGFSLTGFEYWQWKKPDPYDGGNEVVWGYNGDGEPKTGFLPTEPSRACMAESFKALETILADPPQEMKDLLATHGVGQFWFWNNDMTDAKSTVKVPKGNSELWLYEPTREDGGLIKWISATERDGTCKLPTREDLVLFAKGCLKTFTTGSCGSGK